jgi:hypothetical protein
MGDKVNKKRRQEIRAKIAATIQETVEFATLQQINKARLQASFWMGLAIVEAAIITLGVLNYVL